MFDENKILAFIPARAGSKGIKGKNIFPIFDKPLMSYTIENALHSNYIDEVIVSTDSEKISEVAKKYGANVPFLRPPELASDTSNTVDAILHAISELAKNKKIFDDLILLQPTSPLRTTKDIDGAVKKYFKFNRKSLVSVSKAEESPILMRTILAEDRMEKLLQVNSTVRRQDMPNFYKINGAIYINKISEINEKTSFNDNIVPYVMDSDHSVDVDDYQDLEIVKYFIKRGEIF